MVVSNGGCDHDTGLSGCYAANMPPCLSTSLTTTGTYYDRNADLWTLTPIPPAQGWDGMVLEADGVGPNGAAMHLRFTIHAHFVSGPVC